MFPFSIATAVLAAVLQVLHHSVDGTDTSVISAVRLGGIITYRHLALIMFACNGTNFYKIHKTSFKLVTSIIKYLLIALYKPGDGLSYPERFY